MAPEIWMLSKLVCQSDAHLDVGLDGLCVAIIRYSDLSTSTPHHFERVRRVCVVFVQETKD